MKKDRVPSWSFLYHRKVRLDADFFKERFMMNKGKSKKKRRAIRRFLLFSLPALTVYTLFWMLPIAMSAGVSFTDWTGMTKLSDASFIGLKNYRSLLGDSILKIAVKNNLVYGLIMMLVVPVTSFVIAYLIENFIRRKAFFRTVAYLPAILPSIVVVMLWKWMYNPSYGLLNKILEAIGLGGFTTGWLTNADTALYAVTLTSIWKTVPVYFVLFMAGLQSVPKDLVEAAVLDGADRLLVIRHVILPSMRKIVTIVYILVFIDVFRVFDLIYAMTGGGPGYYNTEMLLTYGYKTTFTNSNAGYGMAITTILILFAMLCTGFQLHFQNKTQD